MINKKASSLTAWVFGIIIILILLVVIQNEVLNPMNSMYNKSFEIGLNTSSLTSFSNLKNTGHTEVGGAVVETDGNGLTAKSAWTIGKGIYNTLADFVSGGFIENVFAMLDLPPYFAQYVIVLIWISLILIVVYIFIKVVP